MPVPSEPAAAATDPRQASADSPPGETAEPVLRAAAPAQPAPPPPQHEAPTWAAAASPPPPAAAPRRGWTSVIIGLILLAAVGVTYAFRDQITAAVPATKPIFQLAELPLQQAGDGLAFINLASGPVVENGQPMLRVTGFIENTLDFRRAIPWVRVEVRDAQKKVIASASRPPPQPGTIEPKAAMRIVYDLPQPAESTEGLEVALRFVEAPQN